MDIAKFSLKNWLLLVFIVYLILFLFKTNKKRVVFGNKNVIEVKSVGVLIVIFLLSILAANRTGIGDTSNYINIFKSVPTDLNEFLIDLDFSKEYGFFILNFIIKQIIGDSEFLYLLVTSGFVIGTNLWFMNKYGKDIEVCGSLFIMCGLFITGLNGLRQSIVAAFFILMIPLIKEKKYLRYFICCFLLSTIHKSAVLLLPVVFIFNCKAWGKMTFILIFLGLIAYILYPLFGDFLTIMLSDGAYSGYITGIVTGTAGAANFLRVIVKFVPVLLAFLYRNKLNKNENFSILLHASILSFVFMLLASVKSWIFARLCIYFDIMSITLLSECINISNKDKKILYLLCLVFYCLFFYYELITTVL